MSEELGVWPSIWFWVFAIGSSFFLLTIIYSLIAGFFDIKKLFEALRSSERDTAENEKD